MTRDEIRLIVFVLLAFAVGAAVQWYKGRDPALEAKRPADRKTGWANPPYVFKSRAQMDQVKQNLESRRPRE